MIVIDTEIKNMIPERNGVKTPDVTYCDGWGDYNGMGIAVACAYDYDTKSKYAFWDCDSALVPAFTQPDYFNGTLADLRVLIEKTDYVVGYNNHTFDNKLLAAFDVVIPANKSYDIYPQIIQAAGLSDAPFAMRKGYKLGDVARANKMAGKSGDGAAAPLLWQSGKLIELRDYCMHDVRLTKGILDKIMLKSLICAKTFGIMSIPTPAEVLGPVQPMLGLK